jgi:hypothetical protein
MHRLQTHKGRLIAMMALTAIITLLTASLAMANTSNGTEFQTLYDRVMSWVTGLPAIIIAVAIAFMGIIRGFQTGTIIWPLAGLLVAAFVFLVPTIINGMGGATI